MECYRKFVALSKAQRIKLSGKNIEESESGVATEEPICANVTPRITRKDVKSNPSVSNTGIFPLACLFCNQKRKKVQGTEQRLIKVETKDFEQQVRHYVDLLDDETMLAKISNIDFVAKEVKYHACCRIKYQTRAEIRMREEVKKAGKTSVKAKSIWHIQRESHAQSFEALTSFVDRSIFEANEVLLLTDINNHYQYLLKEFGGTEYEDSRSTAQKLEEKLRSHYGGKIGIVNGHTRKGNIVFSATMSVEEALRRQDNRAADLKAKIRDTALALRAEINKARKTPLPNSLNLSDLEKGRG